MTEDLPRLYVIADWDAAGGDEEVLLARAIEAAEAGARMFQWRAKGLSTGEFHRVAEELIIRLYPYGARCLVNDRADVAFALDADGVHSTSDGMPIGDVRRIVEHDIVGVSCHYVQDVLDAEAAGADFATLSPVYRSLSKPGYAAIGLDTLEMACAESEIPVYALGGIDAGRVAQCLRRGAWGVAVMSAIMAAADAFEATTEILDALESDR